MAAGLKQGASDATYDAQFSGVTTIATGDIGTYEGYGFRLASTTGLLTGTLSGAPIFSFRNATANRKARILAVNVNAEGAVQTTAIAMTLSMYIARSFTASDSGGTALAGRSAGNNSNKLRTSQVASFILTGGGDARIATTGTLTAGTRTLDSNPVGNIVCGVTTTVANLIQDIPLYADYTTLYGIPLVLAANEGFVIEATTTLGTGTAIVGVSVLWAEVDGGAFGTG